MTLNHNILQSIVSYIPMKNNTPMCSVNKTINTFMNQNFNYQWREECNEYFYSPKNESDSMDCLYYSKDLDIKSISSEINWKSHFKTMINNRQILKSYSNQNYHQFISQFLSFESDLFNALRSDSYLPKLRKSNNVFESSIKTPHQIFFFDLKKEEHFLYQYYDKYFYQFNQELIFETKVSLYLI